MSPREPDKKQRRDLQHTLAVIGRLRASGISDDHIARKLGVSVDRLKQYEQRNRP